MKSQLTVERVESLSGFESLHEEWNALLAQSVNNEITLTWEWLYLWWDVFKDDQRRLMILVIRDDKGEMVGLAPLQISDFQPRCFFSTITIRRLSFLAFGEKKTDEICTDYLNFMIRLGDEHEVVFRIFDYLMRDLVLEWDEIIFDSVLTRSLNIQQLKVAMEQDQKTDDQQIDKGHCYYIPLPSDWDQFLASIGGDLRRKYRYFLKRLESRGVVTYEGVKRQEELSHGLSRLAELHQKRWIDQGKVGVFSSEKFCLFHERFSTIALKNGWLQLRFLCLNGNPVAAIYNFIYNGKVYFYQCATSTELTNDISPGTLMIGHSIQEAIAMGMREFDFFHGDHPYKKRWTSLCREMQTIRVASDSAKIKVLWKARAIKDSLLKILK